jgi:hypothetical protein
LEDGIGGDGSDPETTAGLAAVYADAVTPLKGVDIVAAVLKVLKKSVVTVVGEIGQNQEIGGGGNQTTSLKTTEPVLGIPPSGRAAVGTAAEVLHVVEPCHRVFEAGGVVTSRPVIAGK